MKLSPMKTARRLTLKSDAFEIFYLTALIVLCIIFLSFLCLAAFSLFMVLMMQIALLAAIYVFIQCCARRQSLTILAVAKNRIAAELAALRT